MKILKSFTLLLAFSFGLSFLTAAQDMDSSATSDAQGKTIVTLASQNSNLSTLTKAVKAAGLVETLNSAGPFTVFAPTNEAFAALPDSTLQNLMKPENKDKLKKILTYHVVPKKIMASDLSDGQTAKTSAGEDVNISVDGSDVMVNDANVTEPDIQASNGVIHVIDKVIMPPSDKMDNDTGQ